MKTDHKLTSLFGKLIAFLGKDINREGLKHTSKQTATTFRFLTQGYNQDIYSVVNGALFSCDSNEMVVVRNIELFSLCEHHLLPIVGKCHIGYIPNGKIIGLSKIARIVDVYAKRLQIQENLTKQIAEGVMEVTVALGAAVVIEAQHLCVMARGVEKQHVFVKTLSMLGSFEKDAVIRSKFLTKINDN